MTIAPSRRRRNLRPSLVAVLLLAAAPLALAQGTAPGADHASDGAAASLDEPGLNERWKGDLDDMVKRRRIRVLVVMNKTNYFLDGPDQKGATHDVMKLFEDFINKRSKAGTLKTSVVLIPVRRDQLLPGLLEGRGDIAAANLTDTPERRKLVDFGAPLLTDVSEVLVTGPSAPPVARLDDLAGKEVWVRKSSSFYEHLLAVNRDFAKRKLAPIQIRPADELLEVEDLIEMVNAGLLPMTFADNRVADLWSQIFDDIRVHPTVAIATGGHSAWAVRKNSPQLKEAIAGFVAQSGVGTLHGNMILKRYLKDGKYLRNSTSPEDRQKYQNLAALFQRYGAKYDFDWLMIAAQAYQESRLDHSVKSPAGAIGVMQVLPTTAKDKNVGIPNIHEIEPNIHAGVKYLRFVVNQYFKDEPMDRLNKTLFAFASYNAGPAKVSRMRKKAAAMGLDPNKWFQNVEVVAAKEIGRETVTYVSNIYKYYLVYHLLEQHTREKKAVLKKAS